MLSQVGHDAFDIHETLPENTEKKTGKFARKRKK